MTSVVLFRHQGVHAAAPASQVVRLDAQQHAHEIAPAILLWPGEPEKRERLLVFRGAHASFALWCEAVNLHELDESNLRSLPVLLREILCDMPHVVGAAWVRESMFWLVDLSRFSGRGSSK